MVNRRVKPCRASSDLRLTYVLPWYVHVPKSLWKIVGKKRAKFATKHAASAFAKDIETKRTMLENRRQYAAISKEIFERPGFARLEEAVKAEKVDEHPPMTLTDAFELVISAKKLSGKRSNSVATLKCSLKSFEEACQKPAGDVLPADVETWLYSNDLAPKTRKGRHTDLSTAFALLVKRNLVAKNPVAAVDAPAVPYKAAATMPVDDIAKLLQTCQQSDPALIGYLALILFGGLRSKESSRALPENVHDGIVDIGGDQTKLNVRRCFPIQPVLAAWLSVPGAEIGGNKIYQRFVALWKLAGVTVPDNGLRHTAASCWLELLGSKDAAKMLGHSESTLYKHYASKVTHADAERFIALRPTPIQNPPTL